MTVRPAVVLAAATATGTAVATVVGIAVAAGPAAGVSGATLPAARLLLDCCAVAAVGIAVLRWLVLDAKRRDAGAVRSASAMAGAVIAGAWAALALVVLWLQAAELSGRPVDRIGVRTLSDYIGGFSSGTGLLVTAGCAVGFGVAAQRELPDGLLAVIAVLGLLPPPITGHAATAAWHELAVLSVAVHATAAAAWVGGLGVLVAAAGARRSLLATALPRFSRLAGWCLAALAASGVLNAAIRLGSPDALTGTGYGRILLAKTALLVVLAALGGTVRRRVAPAVVAHRPSSLHTFAGVELVLMATALGLAAALTRAVP